jgi:hypothetical protein
MTKTFIPPLLAAVLIALVAPAAAQIGIAKNPAVAKKPPPAAKNAPAAKKTSEFDAPIVFYLAKGEANACGPGCSEWIAAEGRLDAGADQRLRALLTKLGKRKLPIFFHSPGGSGTAGIAIGRMLHAREMTAGVSRTLPNACAGQSEAACGALKRRSGTALEASLNPLAACNSACVYALIGAKVREVPPGARLGVHAAKVVLVHASARVDSIPKATLAAHLKTRAAEFNAQLRRYVQEMKVDVGLYDLSARIPHERAHFLSRDEIARFGIDTRAFQEARWLTMEAGPQKISLVKFVVEPSGANRKELRTSLIQVDCLQPRSVKIAYIRGLGSGEAPAERTVGLDTGERAAVFRASRTAKAIDSLETGVLFEGWFADQPFEFLEQAAARETIDLVERDLGGETTRVTTLSTAGLLQAIAALRKRCDVPAFSGDGSAVPYLEMPNRP